MCAGQGTTTHSKVTQLQIASTVTFALDCHEAHPKYLCRTSKCTDTPAHAKPGGCFTNVSRALQNNLAKIHNVGNYIYGENLKLKFCTCAQSMALGSHTNFQLQIIIRSTISAIHKFRENILESSQNVSETTPWFYWDCNDIDAGKHDSHFCPLYILKSCSCM